jgi:hypothetical protein
MAKQTINIGTSPNDRTGDPLRTAFGKINQNFTELYTLTGGSVAELTELAQDYAAEMFTNGTHSGFIADYDDEANALNLILDVNIDGGSASTVFVVQDLIVDGGGA